MTGQRRSAHSLRSRALRSYVDGKSSSSMIRLASRTLRCVAIFAGTMRLSIRSAAHLSGSPVVATVGERVT
jgi:hypothetical protein